MQKEIFIHNIEQKMENNHLERMTEEELEQGYIKMCGLKYRFGEQAHLIWIVVAVIEEDIKDTDEVPEYMMRTPYKEGHASEIAYVFNNLQKNATKTQRQVADVFHRRVVNFIKTGNPNTDGNTEEKIIWNTYEENNSSVFRISDRQHMEAFKLKDRLEILESELFK